MYADSKVTAVLGNSIFERFDVDYKNAAEMVEWIRRVWRVCENVLFLKRSRVDRASNLIRLGVRVHLGSAREVFSKITSLNNLKLKVPMK